MKETYIALMEWTLSAYSEAHIKRYFNDVQENGLKEHGFPRLTANIGILIAHGRRRDLKPIFLEMMEFCCKTIPVVKAANDFSVREIICCLREVEENHVADEETLARWKAYLSSIDPETCYTRFARTPTDNVKNWALFTGVSEFFRKQAGLGGSEDFIDLQLVSQLQWLDENGMYMDGLEENHHPVVYDLVPRGLFAAVLTEGYRGKYFGQIDEALKRAGMLTLLMQSPNGEHPFGGRSNQFIHNETWMSAVYEYEAARYAREGNFALAGEFKAAIKRAVAVITEWLSMEPIYHVKNRFPLETGYGCEDYAYFDKYMITVASNLYAAYLMCDDSIPAADTEDDQPAVFATSSHFHKVFLKAGGYGLEFDYDADPHYDATGLGRVHRKGAPAALCLSVPCSATPDYNVDIAEPAALSLSSAVKVDGAWHFAVDTKVDYVLKALQKDEKKVNCAWDIRFPEGTCVSEKYQVSSKGVVIEITGEGEIGYLFPAFSFDGETHTAVVQDKNVLTVLYKGWTCRYTVEGEITETNRISANRNGHYKAYLATAKDNLKIVIELLEEK